MSSYVYRAFNAEGDLLYVGCTYQPAERMRAHSFHTLWWFAAKRFAFEAFDDYTEALAAETAAIQAERPRWNIRKRAIDHPDGHRMNRAQVARMYPGDDRRVTHPNIRLVYEGPGLRARMVWEVAA